MLQKSDDYDYSHRFFNFIPKLKNSLILRNIYTFLLLYFLIIKKIALNTKLILFRKKTIYVYFFLKTVDNNFFILLLRNIKEKQTP